MSKTWPSDLSYVMRKHIGFFAYTVEKKICMFFFLSSADFFFFKSTFFILFFFRNTFRVSNSLDPVQARHFVGPDLDPNYL